MNTHAISLSFAERFHSLRRRYLLVQSITWCCLVGACLCTGWAALAVLDYVFEMPLIWRQILLLIVAFAIVAIALPPMIKIYKHAAQRPFASLLEQSFNGFGQRIRTILDMLAGRITGPDAMMTALANQTIGRWETIEPNQILPSKKLAWVAGAFLLLSTAIIVSLNLQGDWHTALLRTLGQDIPYTTWEVLPGNGKVLERAPAVLSIDLIGRPHRQVNLKYRFQPLAIEGNKDDLNLEWIESEMLPLASEQSADTNQSRMRYQFDAGKAKNDIEYQFVTSVGMTPVYRLSVQPLIQATSTQIVSQPPAYTRLDERVYSSSDVTVLEGSTLRGVIETNHPLKSATLRLGKSKAELSEATSPQQVSSQKWEFQLSSADSTYWSFDGIGADGTPMQRVEGRIRVRGDSAPKLSWLGPADEFKAHSLAELPMKVLVTDDYGVSEVAIAFQLGEEEFILKEWKSETGEDLEQLPPTKVDVGGTLPLESFELTEREYVSYYAYAIDNREGSPQRVESDIRYIDIRPFRQKYSLQEEDPNGGGDGQNQFFVTLDEIVRRQRFVLNRTRQLKGSNPQAQLGTIDRLVENQSGLASLTRFLIERLAVFGLADDDYASLTHAESTMLQAADSLASVSFDLAYVQENEALRSLVETRNTLQMTVFNNFDRMQMRQLREIARQLQQKLRMNRPKTKYELADSLEALAREQASVSAQAASLPAMQEKSASSQPQPTDANNADQAEAPMSDEDKVVELTKVLKSTQVDLQDRFADVRDDLEQSVSSSTLLADRLKKATKGFDTLEETMDRNQWVSVSAESTEVTKLLFETALHVRAIAPIEPLARISELRAMSVSLSQLENELAHELQQGISDGVVDEKLIARLAELGKRFDMRIETTRDALFVSPAVGDIETSEVNDFLKQFLDDTKYDKLLDNASAAYRESVSVTDFNLDKLKGLIDQSAAIESEFTDAAAALGELYEQLLAPRLDQLRNLEQEASQMMEGMTDNGTSDKPISENEIDSEIKNLEQELREAGLNDLVELLQDAAASEEPESPPEGSVAPNIQYGTSLGKRYVRQLQFVLTNLRTRIQEMLLLEISPDRNIPVPQQYKHAVDEYFERLAKSSSQEGETP